MVQVLEAVPSFGSGLANALTQATGSLAQGLMQRSAMSQLQKLLVPQTTQNLQPGQTPQSPIQSMFSQPNGPSLGNIIGVQKIVENALGKEAGTTAMNYLLNQQKQAGKEAIINQERISKGIQEEQKASIGKRDSILKQKQEYARAKTAIDTGDIGGFDINYFANLMGPAGEPLKTMQGAALESAMKGNLIDTLSDVSGQKNMWLEKMARSATPGIGKKKEANLALIRMGEGKLELEELMLNTRDDMRALYEAKGQTPPSNLDYLVHKKIKKEAQLIQDKEAYDVRKIYEQSQGTNYLNNLEKVPQGTPLTLEKRDALMNKFKGNKQKVINVAKQLGYTIPSLEIVKGSLPIEGQNEQ